MNNFRENVQPIDFSEKLAESRFTNVSDFLAECSKDLPYFFDKDLLFYSWNKRLLINFGESPIGVISTWVDPLTVAHKVKTGYIGSLVSEIGVDVLIRNCLAHPEIQNIIIAGGNINPKIPSGSNALLELKARYDSGYNQEQLYDYAQKFNLSEEVRLNLFEFFNRVEIYDLFGNGNLQIEDSNAHWEVVQEKVDEITQNLSFSQLEFEQPLYLRYVESNERIKKWIDNNNPIILDASNTSVVNAYRMMVAEISRYGEMKRKTPALSENLGEASTIEKRGYRIKLNPLIDPLNLPDEDLMAFFGLKEVNEQNRLEAQIQMTEYLKQITEEPEAGTIASYTYGQIIGPAMPRVLQELTQTKFSNIRLLKQEDITAENPDCLTYIAFRIINGELFLDANLRSNDMIDAWPKNAYGIINLARKIAQELNLEIGEISTFSESAHFRDSGYSKVNKVELAGDLNYELIDGERVDVIISRNKLGKLTIKVGDVTLNPNIRLNNDQNIPAIINELTNVFGVAILSNPDEIVRFTIALTEMLANSSIESIFTIPVYEIDSIIRVSQIRGKDNPINKAKRGIASDIFKSYPNLYFIEDIEGDIDLRMKIINLKLDEIDIEDIDITIGDEAMNLLMELFLENLFAKSAILIANGEININYSELQNTHPKLDGKELPGKIIQTQFLIGADGTFNLTSIIEGLDILSTDLDKVVKWLKVLSKKLFEKLKDLLNEPTHSHLLADLKLGALNLNLLNSRISRDEFGQARENAKDHRVLVYIEDARGSFIVNNQGTEINLTMNNNGKLENVTYSIDPSISVSENTYNIVSDYILKRRMISNLGHIEYVVRNVWYKVNQILKQLEA